MPRKKPLGKKLVSVAIRSPNSQCVQPIAEDVMNKKPVRFRPGEKQEFQLFKKRAKKAGLLVTRNCYELYFRNHFTER
jgi:hypothetical protein